MNWPPQAGMESNRVVNKQRAVVLTGQAPVIMLLPFTVTELSGLQGLGRPSPGVGEFRRKRPNQSPLIEISIAEAQAHSRCPVWQYGVHNA